MVERPTPATVTDAFRSGLRRLGGPHATDVRTLAVLVAILVLDRVGTDLERTAASPLLLVASTLGGAALLVAALRLARVTVLADVAVRRRPGRTLAVLVPAVVASVEATRRLDGVLGIVGSVGADEGAAHLIERGIFVTALAAIATVAVDAQRAHRTTIGRLVEHRVRLERTRFEVTERIAAGQRWTLARIAALVRRDLDRLTPDDPAATVALLRHAGEEVLRPVSHELARPGGGYVPSTLPPVARRPGWRAIVADATSRRPIRPALTASIMGLYGVLGPAPGSGLAVRALAGAALLTTGWVTLALAGRAVDLALPHLGPLARALVTYAALLAAGTAMLLVTAAILSPLGSTAVGPVGPVQTLVRVINFTLVPTAQMLARASRALGREAVAELGRLNDELAWRVARANTILWHQRRALSRALHGPVQAAVNAAALRLDAIAQERPLTTADVDAARREVTAALDAVEATIDRRPGEDDVDLDVALARVQGLWAGLCEVHVDLPDDVRARLGHDPTCATAVVDLVTEACSDAVRHGGATSAEVRLALADAQRLALTVRDDGRPPDVPGAPGQGSALLDEVTLAWTRTHHADGTDLEAVLATR